jgi:hypothetical protein
VKGPLVASPKTPISGRKFQAAIKVTTNKLGGLLSSGHVACTAKIGTKTVKVLSKELSRSLTGSGASRATVGARCIWAVPKKMAKKTLRGSVAVLYNGRRASRSFALKIR